MGGNASKVGFEAIVKQLTTKEVNPTDYEVSAYHSFDDILTSCDYAEDCKTFGKYWTRLSVYTLSHTFLIVNTTFHATILKIFFSHNLRQFWDEMWKTTLSVDQIFEYFPPDDVRKLIKDRPSNLKTLFTQAVAQLFQVVETPYPVYFDQALNCTRYKWPSCFLKRDNDNVKDVRYEVPPLQTYLNYEVLHTANINTNDGTSTMRSSEFLFTVKLPTGTVRFEPFLTRPSMIQTTLQDSFEGSPVHAGEWQWVC
jgi:hypothetical protein